MGNEVETESADIKVLETYQDGRPKVVERDGVQYKMHNIKHDGKELGQLPARIVPDLGTLIELIESGEYSESLVFESALSKMVIVRQAVVREIASGGKDKLTDAVKNEMLNKLTIDEFKTNAGHLDTYIKAKWEDNKEELSTTFDKLTIHWGQALGVPVAIHNVAVLKE